MRLETKLLLSGKLWANQPGARPVELIRNAVLTLDPAEDKDAFGPDGSGDGA